MCSAPPLILILQLVANYYMINIKTPKTVQKIIYPLTPSYEARILWLILALKFMLKQRETSYIPLYKFRPYISNVVSHTAKLNSHFPLSSKLGHIFKAYPDISASSKAAQMEHWTNQPLTPFLPSLHTPPHLEAQLSLGSLYLFRTL